MSHEYSAAVINEFVAAIYLSSQVLAIRLPLLQLPQVGIRTGFAALPTAFD